MSTDDSAPPLPDLDHAHYLRLAFRVAQRARDGGQHPFGAILVGPKGEVLMEQENGYLPDHDMTGHAERVLMTRAGLAYRPRFLAACSMYTSAEPCAMCSGAAYWVGVGRVVYGLSEVRVGFYTGDHPENPTLDLPCATVFAAGRRRIEVIGPMLEEEAEALHRTAWQR